MDSCTINQKQLKLFVSAEEYTDKSMQLTKSILKGCQYTQELRIQDNKYYTWRKDALFGKHCLGKLGGKWRIN